METPRKNARKKDLETLIEALNSPSELRTGEKAEIVGRKIKLTLEQGSILSIDLREGGRVYNHLKFTYGMVIDSFDLQDSTDSTVVLLSLSIA